MITEDKIFFCIVDDFWKFYDALMEKYTFKAVKKRSYHRVGRMSKAEVMIIMILFHSSGYRCLKHFYTDKICKHMCHLFPIVASYNRFVELEREVALPLAIFIKKVLLGKCTGISFVDSASINWKSFGKEMNEWKSCTLWCRMRFALCMVRGCWA